MQGGYGGGSGGDGDEAPAGVVNTVVVAVVPVAGVDGGGCCYVVSGHRSHSWLLATAGPSCQLITAAPVSPRLRHSPDSGYRAADLAHMQDCNDNCPAACNCFLTVFKLSPLLLSTHFQCIY